MLCSSRFRMKNRASDRWQTIGRDRRTPKVARREPTTKRNQPPRQTILYVPLPMFWTQNRALEALCRPPSVENSRKLSIMSKSVENSRNLLKLPRVPTVRREGEVYQFQLGATGCNSL